MPWVNLSVHTGQPQPNRRGVRQRKVSIQIQIKASSSKNAQNLQYHGLGTQLNKNHAKVTTLELNPHTETRQTPTKG